MLSLFSCFSRSSVDYSDPIATLRTLQRAITYEKWSVAGSCFSDEMRRANASAIETRVFYLTNYWTKSVGGTNLFGPVLWLDEKATFVVAAQDGRSATVEVNYHPYREKDPRIQHVLLSRSPDGWKISELYGQIRPGTSTSRRTTGKP
jgi:hypothetical protein